MVTTYEETKLYEGDDVCLTIKIWDSGYREIAISKGGRSLTLSDQNILELETLIKEYKENYREASE